LQNSLFLTATDTTIGFISKDSKKLDSVKQRPPSKYYIKALDSLYSLKGYTRIPKAHKKWVRRAQKSTFITPSGRSFRVIKDPHHLLLLQRLGWAYTTSANLSGKEYDPNFAKEAADIIVLPLKSSGRASKIVKLGKQRAKRIR